MNAGGIRNLSSKGEITPLNSLLANRKSIKNTGNVYYVPTSISAGVMVSKEMVDLTREEVQLRIDAAEARTDTKIARIEGKLDLVLQAVQSTRDEARDNRRAIIANAWVIFGAIIVVIGIVATIAPTIFDMGFKWRETITNEIQNRIPPR